MPDKHHPHDSKWISEQVAILPPSLRVGACEAYSSVFTEAFEAEPVDHKRSNAARFCANTRLREYVDRVCEHIKKGNKK